ncbi:hypothetical protein KQ51_00776 [Candidatus Izimaplasma bacterium HR1]|jgi:hypothetical protein|uniref:zinc ribbon domain-containing protein n=1 Tax=Candidatus Izimoplasma sp. HR1 TaxID=1541959 RepID=UPI0004F9323A|nr:hypothetical protein KQ51_00776 [Candidatus Izimaplasma bacterium HR1]
MNERYTRIFGFSAILASIGVIVLSMYQNSIILLIIGGTSLVVSVFVVIMVSSLAIFGKDKKLDIETLMKQGLHIVKCIECGNDNVLEDKYCTHCGEILVSIDEKI